MRSLAMAEQQPRQVRAQAHVQRAVERMPAPQSLPIQAKIFVGMAVAQPFAHFPAVECPLEQTEHRVHVEPGIGASGRGTPPAHFFPRKPGRADQLEKGAPRSWPTDVPSQPSSLWALYQG